MFFKYLQDIYIKLHCGLNKYIYSRHNCWFDLFYFQHYQTDNNYTYCEAYHLLSFRYFLFNPANFNLVGLLFIGNWIISQKIVKYSSDYILKQNFFTKWDNIYYYEVKKLSFYILSYWQPELDCIIIKYLYFTLFSIFNLLINKTRK